MQSRSITCSHVDMDTTCRHFGSPGPPTLGGIKIFDINFSQTLCAGSVGVFVLHSLECSARAPTVEREPQFKVFQLQYVRVVRSGSDPALHLRISATVEMAGVLLALRDPPTG